MKVEVLYTVPQNLPSNFKYPYGLRDGYIFFKFNYTAPPKKVLTVQYSYYTIKLVKRYLLIINLW